MKVRSKGHKDIVTEFDTEAEREAMAIIKKRFPEHDILAEESGATAAGHSASEFIWTVDPIDGTHNYAAQLPFWCTSVALLEAATGKAVAGVVFDALHKELFTAWRGGGSYLNGNRVHVSDTSDLGEAFLCTDIGYGPDVARRMTALSPWVQPRIKRYRLIGSAVLSMVYVANGRFDGYYHLSLQPWDIAAAALLIEEAGGTMTDWEGKALTGGQTSAITANPTLHPLLMQMLHEGASQVW
jgi:myo-inositol-1(or 4)-monophosphatase